MFEANVDLISANGQAQGSIATDLIVNGRLNIGALRPYVHPKTGQPCITVYMGGNVNSATSWKTTPINANATLRRDEWKQLDDALIQVGRERLGGIEDLISKNLIYNLGNAMGTTVLEWHDMSDAMEASVSMDGISRGKNDRPVFQHNYLPIPIIHVDYELNLRTLSASRSLGNPLDTTSAEMATRRVQEKLEDMLFTNTNYSFGEKDARSNNTIYSYINHPDRNQISLTLAWDDSAITPAKILADVNRMKKDAMAALHFGPYMLYIPTEYETVLDEDYDVSGASIMTIRERIMKISGIQGIKVIDRMPANNVLLVQMTSDVVRLVRGLGLQNVEWATEGKFITKYKVLTIQVPQIRSDQNRKSGVTHMA